MKKSLLFLLLTLLGSTVLHAYDACIDGIYYNLSGDEATVTYQKYHDYNYVSDYSGAIVIPASVTYNGRTYSVTCIGEYAFYNCSRLTSVSVPEGVTRVEARAFQSCTNLTSVAIPEGVTSIGSSVFNGCRGLTSVTIGNSVTDIGTYAFYECSSLTSIIIPSNVTSIGQSTFRDCSSLTSVTIPNSVTSIGDYAFGGCSGLTSVTIPNSVTSIGYSAFSNCTSLTSATIPNSVTSLGDYAFVCCSGLTSVVIGNGVTSIGDYAFNGCRNMNSVIIGNNVTSIGIRAFYECYYINSLVIPDGVTSIGSYAFAYCTHLTSVVIPRSVETIGEYAFTVCHGLTYVKVDNPTPVSIPSNTFHDSNYENATLFVPYGSKSAYEAADYWKVFKEIIESEYLDEGLVYTIDNENMTAEIIRFMNNTDKVVIPSSIVYDEETYSVTSIGSQAFNGCGNLTSVTIPNSVTSIGNDAFSGCTGLTSITIPNSVTSIGDCAFDNCMNLTSVTMPASNLSFEGWWAFGGDNNIQSVYISDLMKWLCVDFGSNNPLRSGAKLYLNNVEVNDLVIPDGTTSIHTAAFEGCGSITSVTIPSSVTSIGDWAFSGCSSLTSVTIPSSVTSIGETAFKSCTGLTDVYCYAENVPSTESNAFNDSKVEYSRLHVPAGSVASYKATAPWSGFGAIVGIGEDADTETIEIATAEDLKDFADRVNDGETLLCAKLTADIDFTAYPTSVINEWYYGEFDGAGHSIRLDMNRTSDCALFGNLCGYVHDLTTTGTITTSVMFAAGIAAQTGKATIERCQSRVDINSSVDGDGTHGGIVGVSHVGTIIRDCLVSGSITGSNTTCCGGVSGWADGKTTITNCLIKSTFTVSTTNSDLLSRNPSNVISTNNYFQGEWNAPNNCSNVTLLTESQVESGEACYLLNAGRTGEEMAWYQTLGDDDFPVPDNSHLSVCYSNGLYYNEITDITITIGSTGFATYCSSYPLDFSEVSGMKAYIASGFSPSTGKLVLTRVTEVPAGEGLYLVGEAGTYEVAIAETDMMYSNLLKGVTSATTLYPTDGSYTNFILANGAHGVAFYSLSEAGQLAAGKAYLQLPTASVSDVKAISVIFDDDNEDGIGRPTPAPSRIGGEVYNLQGQQVSAPKSGLYIINGKKMFIK